MSGVARRPSVRALPAAGEAAVVDGDTPGESLQRATNRLFASGNGRGRG